MPLLEIFFSKGSYSTVEYKLVQSDDADGDFYLGCQGLSMMLISWFPVVIFN